MNECLFLAHTLLVFFFILLALRLGKEALTAACALTAIAANLFVLKQINLAGLSATCSDGYVVGSMLSLNLLQERYGGEAAAKAMATTFLAILFFALFSALHLAYIPHSLDTMDPAYQTILTPSPRIVVASFAAYLISQFANLSLFALIKRHFSQWPLALRNLIALLPAQVIDTFIFTLIGLVGLVASITHVMAISIAIKWLAIVTLAPLTALLRKVGSYDKLPL